MFNGRTHSPIAIQIGIVYVCSRFCIVMPRCLGQRRFESRRPSFTAAGQEVILLEESRGPQWARPHDVLRFSLHLHRRGGSCVSPWRDPYFFSSLPRGCLALYTESAFLLPILVLTARFIKKMLAGSLLPYSSSLDQDVCANCIKVNSAPPFAESRMWDLVVGACLAGFFIGYLQICKGGCTDRLMDMGIWPRCQLRPRDCPVSTQRLCDTIRDSAPGYLPHHEVAG